MRNIMNKKMNYESFLALGEKLTYIMALGLLFILCSLPIITIGASATALNKAMKLYVRYGEKRIFQAFFGAFIKFFKPATLVWLLNLVVILILAPGVLTYLSWQFLPKSLDRYKKLMNM